jgi:Sulfotransferase family
VRHQSLRVIEKTPENSLRVSFLAAMFPAARFVFLHRDARQAVSSICQAWRHPGFVKYPDLPGWERPAWHLLLPGGWREFNSASIMEVAAFQWASANRQAMDDLEGLSAESWTSVDYAELVATPAAVVRRICEFAEISYDEWLAAALAQPLPLSPTTITAPSPIKWRSNPDFTESALGRYTFTSARLRDLGKLSAPPPPPRASGGAVRFSCFVDEVAAPARLPEGDIIVAPSFHFQFGSTVPLPLVRKTRSRDRFLGDYPLLWADDPATGMTYPYWVRREEAWRYREFVAGRPPPTWVGHDLTQRLTAVGVLTTRGDHERRRQAGAAGAERARAEFSHAGCCVLSSAVPTPQVSALGSYYRRLVAAGEWAAGDEQVHRRHGWHNEAVARYFHHQLAATVGRVAGEPVKPTYCYVSAYGEGAVLRPHVDRKQCAFTVSLWLDNGENAPAEAWPLWFETNIGRLSVEQQAGDAVVFLGCDLPHWREAPPTGAVSTTLLFHYVARDFIGALD